MTVDLSAIEAVAQKSLKTGSWWDPHDLKESLDRIADVGDDTQADAEYIWRMRPSVALALVTRIRELEGQGGNND